MAKPPRTRTRPSRAEPRQTFARQARELLLACVTFRQQLLAAHASPTPVDVRPLLTALERLMANILPCHKATQSDTQKKHVHRR
jgi:hypothetical protein